jgi:hypothetical protein
MYGSLSEWVESEYKLASIKKKRIDPAGLDYSGLTIWDISETSPAYVLGLRKGDILFTVNGNAPFNADLETPRLKNRKFGLHKFQFYRPATEEVLTIKSKQWPFGIQLQSSPNEYARELRIGDPELSDMENYWRQGRLDDIAEFYTAWEILNYRLRHLGGNPYRKADFPNPHAHEPLDGDLWHSNFAYLALAAACAKQYKRSRYVLDEIYQRIAETKSGFPCIASSMMSYTESLLSEGEGDINQAIEFTHNAINAAWEIEENYERLSRLTGHKVDMPASAFEKTRLSYSLPIKDPANIIAQHTGQLDLQKTCQSLKPDQFLIVVLLSEYRSNYYYDLGWERSAPILSKLKSTFPFIHIVTSGTYSLDESFLSAENHLSKRDVEFKILHDENNEVARRLNLERAPTNLVLNHRGEIIAESALWDESLIWKALSTAF